MSRHRPGSAVVRLDATELTVFQTARCTGPGASDGPDSALNALVDRLVQAADLAAVILEQWGAPCRLRAPGEAIEPLLVQLTQTADGRAALARRTARHASR